MTSLGIQWDDSEPNGGRWGSKRDIAEHFGVGLRTIERHLDEIPHGRVGTATNAPVRIRFADFERWLLECAEEHEPTEEHRRRALKATEAAREARS